MVEKKPKYNKEGKAVIDGFNLKEGQLVEFTVNYPQYRFGIVHGGFGMKYQTSGGKIYAVFGETEEDAINNYVKFSRVWDAHARRHHKNKLCRKGEIFTRDEKVDRGKGKWKTTEEITFGSTQPIMPIEKGQTLVPNKGEPMVEGTSKIYTVEETGKEYKLDPAQIHDITERVNQ